MRYYELYESSFEDLTNRLRSIQALIDRGATEGERDAARLAYDRILNKIKLEYPNQHINIKTQKRTHYNYDKTTDTSDFPKYKVGEIIVIITDNTSYSSQIIGINQRNRTYHIKHGEMYIDIPSNIVFGKTYYYVGDIVAWVVSDYNGEAYEVTGFIKDSLFGYKVKITDDLMQTRAVPEGKLRQYEEYEYSDTEF